MQTSIGLYAPSSINLILAPSTSSAGVPRRMTFPEVLFFAKAVVSTRTCPRELTPHLLQGSDYGKERRDTRNGDPGD